MKKYLILSLVLLFGFMCDSNSSYYANKLTLEDDKGRFLVGGKWELQLKSSTEYNCPMDKLKEISQHNIACIEQIFAESSESTRTDLTLCAEKTKELFCKTNDSERIYYYTIRKGTVDKRVTVDFTCDDVDENNKYFLWCNSLFIKNEDELNNGK